jgi:hypothetical protein
VRTVPQAIAPMPGEHYGDLDPELVAMVRATLDQPARPNFLCTGDTPENARTFEVHQWAAPAPLVADHRRVSCHYRWKIGVDREHGAMIAASEPEPWLRPLEPWEWA